LVLEYGSGGEPDETRDPHREKRSTRDRHSAHDTP
jgi:hypothetical protein